MGNQSKRGKKREFVKPEPKPKPEIIYEQHSTDKHNQRRRIELLEVQVRELQEKQQLLKQVMLDLVALVQPQAIGKIQEPLIIAPTDLRAKGVSLGG